MLETCAICKQRQSLRLALAAIVLLALPGKVLAQWSDLVVKGGITLVYQQELKSNADDASASGDLNLTLPTADGSWFIYIEGATGTDAESIFNIYPEINGDANSVLDRDGGGHIQVSEFLYRMNVGERSQLMLGQIDTSAQIDRSRISNDENTQFLGASFVNNPTIAFPDYTVGMLFRRFAEDRSPEWSLILSSSDGIADNPSRSYSELIDVTGAGKGVFAAVSARWFLGGTEFGAGAWARTDKHPLLDDASRNSSNRGVFAVYGVSRGPQTLNVRAGIANDEVARAARYVGLSYEYKRQAGTFGLGVARIFESRRARSSSSDTTDHIETWYRTAIVADHLHVSADVQYIRNPGFDNTGLIAEAYALVAGLRLDYAF